MSQDIDFFEEESCVEMRLEKGMLSFVNETPDVDSHTSAHIKSWTEGAGSPTLTQHSPQSTSTRDICQTVFEVVQTRIVDEIGQKKHVAYTVMVKTNGERPDLNPAVFERRYSDFLHLYRLLRKQYPQQTKNIIFPKKVILGNFAEGVISMRSHSFEQFLKTIVENEHLKNSSCLRKFLCGPEVKEAKMYLENKHFIIAKPLLENCFRLLNKIYTDRHESVLIALCRLAACCNADPNDVVSAERYADLALHRFEAVSDVNVLCYYVPLLQLCVHLWWKIGKDKRYLDKRLDDLKRCGHKVDSCPTLLEAMMNVD